MAQKDDSERAKALAILDSAIELVQEVLDEPIPNARETAPQVLKLARDSRLQAADRIVSLLERRAKLLGLDAVSEKKSEPERPASGTLAELEKKLALVAPGKAS